MSTFIEPPRSKLTRGPIVFVAVFVLLIAFWRTVGFITDWFWFQEVGYENVFVTTYVAQLETALLFGIGFFIIFYSNLYLASRLSSRLQVIERGDTIELPFLQIDQKTVQGLSLIVSIVFGIFAALNGAGQWEKLLRFLNAVPFGIPDPLFQKDISFYALQMPFLEYVYSWVMTLLIFTIIGTAAVYFLRRSFLFIPPRTWQVAPAARAHLTALAASLFFWGSFGLWLSLNELLFTKRGVVFGPGYTDVTTQLWVLPALMFVCALTGCALILWIFRRDRRIPLFALGLFALLTIAGRGIYPAVIQRFVVVPNEIVLEKPYLEKNIHYSRLAYKLEDIEAREFSTDENLTREDLKRNDLTIKNIRLWNHGPLLQTYGQLQEIRTYYKFTGISNDRYMINNEYRQVMLAARELSYPALPSRSWVNEHLVYTHGYGLVLSPVNRITQEGLPEFFIKDIPPVSTTNIKITRPEIYYGETSNDYVFVRGKRPEFDYPVGDKNVYALYEGSGGVPLSFWKKLLFAARFGSLTILLSDDITSESRVMLYRNIQERVAKIAPFIHLDRDPYMVISPEGRLVWFVDGYTMTNRFPYSEPMPGLGNYIRNAVKIIIDAYDGSVRFYISDPGDPIIQTYARIFPGVFKPLDEMPDSLKKHIRYPPGMLSVQAHMYRTYHMQDAQVFYNKEDLWSIPGKTGKGSEEEMEPYYTIMKLPGEKKEEYVLLMPFTPSNKDNMAAWMAVRCDAPDYGKVIVFNFPKQKLVYGPRQIEARIDQDTEISKQLSLWNQRGSQVIRGSLLAIPIEKSILYVQSLYLAAEKGQLPELKRVIVAYGNSIAMEETLDRSLQRIFGGELTREKETGMPAAQPLSAREKSDRELALEALSHYRRAQDFLKQGNWSAYGEELKKVDETLKLVEKKR
jgi:uncharacterized protein